MALDPNWTGADPELEAARRAGLVPENLPSRPFMATMSPQPDLLPVKPMPPSALDLPVPPGTHSPDLPDRKFDMGRFDPIAPPTFMPAPPSGPIPPTPTDPEAERKALAAAIKVGPDVTTNRIRQSQELKDAKAGLEVLSGKKQKTADALGAHNVRVAEDVSKDADQRILDRQQMEADAAKDRAKIEAEQVKAKDAARELREKHAKDYEKGFFETQGTAKSWIAILSTGLGMIGQGLAQMGGVKIDNLAWEVMQKMMSDHASREKGRLLRQKEEIERRGEDTSRIDQQLKDFDTITMPQMKAALLQKGIERREALMAKHGASKEQIDNDMLKQKMTEDKLNSVITLETQLADRVQISNESQNALRRQQAMLAAKGPNAGRPLTEGQNKGISTVGTALDSIKDALDTTQPLSKKDREILRKIEAQARTIKDSEPGKAWAAFAQISGDYYNQLSPNGNARLRAFEQGFRDLERNTSGAMIGPVETMGLIARAQEPGGIKVAIQRARRFSNFAGPKQAEVLAEVDAFEKNLGNREGPATDNKAVAAIRAEATQLLRTVRDPGNRERLEWVIKNPSDTRASAALSKARSQ